jgi:hypothetical protein
MAAAKHKMNEKVSKIKIAFEVIFFYFSVGNNNQVGHSSRALHAKVFLIIGGWCLFIETTTKN